MADTNYGTNHPLAVKRWSKGLMKETLKNTHVMQFMGTSANNIVQIKTELGKDAGDKVTFGLRLQLAGDGIAGDGTLEGNEEALVTYDDSVTIDQLRHAVRSKGKMSEQRVPFTVRDEARDGLADWWADRMDSAFFNQVCGNTAETDTKRTGMQAAVAPSTNRVIYQNAPTAEVSLSSTDTFTLELIDYAVELAITGGDAGDQIPLVPIRVGNEKKFVMFLHPYQVTDLRTNTATGQWLDIQKAAMNGGKVSNNPIFTGALGEYNGVVLHSNTRVPAAPTNSSARRAVLCGAQAVACAFGRQAGKNTYSWNEELFDYKNQLGVGAGAIWGMKKCQFNSEDFGSVVVTSYAAKHTG
jgi:N4-gp56 family major capsid protein